MDSKNNIILVASCLLIIASITAFLLGSSKGNYEKNKMCSDEIGKMKPEISSNGKIEFEQVYFSPKRQTCLAVKKQTGTYTLKHNPDSAKKDNYNLYNFTTTEYILEDIFTKEVLNSFSTNSKVIGGKCIEHTQLFIPITGNKCIFASDSPYARYDEYNQLNAIKDLDNRELKEIDSADNGVRFWADVQSYK